MDQGWVTDLVRRALAEDVGVGDLTTRAVVKDEATGVGLLEAREECVLAGVEVAREVFRHLDAEGTRFPGDLEDGRIMKRGARVPMVAGRLASILTGERVALNVLQRASGIATLTREFVRAAGGTPIRDTRKTTPGLRPLEKLAVVVGGGTNHRFGLWDGVLVKDNHIAAAGGVRNAVLAARSAGRPVEVECENLDQVAEALDVGADEILLDNMELRTLARAVEMARGRARTEASGGVTLETVAAIAATGVDAISVGALTHSAPSVDLALDVETD